LFDLFLREEEEVGLVICCCDLKGDIYIGWAKREKTLYI
jgi:hypothetical protein